MNSPRKTSHPQSGQSMLELALLLPLLMVLLMGVIDMGRYMYTDILIANAARAGAAYGATHPGDALLTGYGGITTAADNDFQNNGQAVASLTVTASLSCGCDSGGTVTTDFTGSSCTGLSQSTIDTECTGTGSWVSTVAVTASGTFSALVPYPGVPSSITISNTATMRVQE